MKQKIGDILLSILYILMFAIIIWVCWCYAVRNAKIDKMLQDHAREVAQ